VRRSLATCLAAAGAALALAAPGSPASIQGLGRLPAGWTHAEINVTIRRVPHTLVVNRGLVQALDADSLTLREADGSVVDVPVDSSTQFVINGQPGSLTGLRVGATALTEQLDGGPAQLVQAQVPLRLAAPPAARVRKG
jgi:hypothetical protein